MILFVAFLFLAIYNAGGMTVLQLQHYAIYPAVGTEHFADYVGANNRAAPLPTIVPAMLLLLCSVAVIFARPEFVRPYETAVAAGLNLVALVSTFVWQRPIQGQLARSGYDEASVRRLISTNWIRTIAHWLLALLATGILVRLIAV